MKNALIPLLFIFYAINCFGQEMQNGKVLCIQSKKTKKVVSCPEGEDVDIKTNSENSDTYNGRLLIINDSTISINSFEIPIASIASIRFANKADKTTGGVFVGVGMAGIIGSGLLIRGATKQSDLRSLALMLLGGLALIPVSIISIVSATMLLGQKAYYSAEKHNISVGSICSLDDLSTKLVLLNY